MACRVFQIISLLTIILWLSPLISGNTKEGDLSCTPYLMVPRNTVWMARVMGTLKINCTVKSENHCWKKYDKDISWCRLHNNNCRPLNISSHIRTEWKSINNSTGISFLTFQNLSMEDSGLYRCEVNLPSHQISHSVNVTVTGNILIDNMDNIEEMDIDGRNENNPNSSSEEMEWVWPYVYICSGIVVLVVIVSLLFIRCRGKKELRKARSDKKAENQATATRIADPAPLLHDIRAQNSSSSQGNTHSLPSQLTPPSCLYDNIPVRAASQRAARQPANQGASGRFHDRDTVEEEEEVTSVIYSSLNHEAALQRLVRVNHSLIEACKYAAIKVLYE